MKNDIQYIIQCQNIAEQRDTLTGMLNENGLKNAFCVADKENLYLVGFQVCLFQSNFIAVNERGKINAITDAARCILEFCNSNDACARINDNIFISILQSEASPEVLEDRLESFLCQHKNYMETYGLDSFICCALSCSDMSFSKIMSDFKESMSKKSKIIFNRHNMKHYSDLLALRNHIYKNPEDTFDMDKIYSLFNGSIGYLRSVYKKCFGVSLLQDCISARMAKAKYLLITTSMNCADISEACGYSDNKYFMRQFSSEIGMTASRYKML